ncbi:cupin domain-containing protein [Streptomyces sp. H10-C2]|uniref:JmjC domain-containing protein n=1 Tax=unclassified Streptomyces TaxID=2593676 RepID=UPI0024B8A9B9|nr:MULTISPECIES: cupin domain-containing protein [unclassified Streptomyces]MDJ0346302.1 cupin domain-containing protein [Streptomyces sp. PH10-H1]MDJ0374911.1 cupin domain-containing protein [Streptomyces sp. H10-C2]
MEHRLVRAIEEALGWDGPGRLGTEFARGSISDHLVLGRILTPPRLLDMIMRRSLANPQFRFFKGGGELHPDAYLTPQITPRGQAIPMVDMRRVGSLLREGATLVLDQSNVFDPTMEVVCRAMQWWSREHVQANVYLTTNDASGFDLHWDDHDVLIVQLAGEKQWEVRGASRAVPMFRDAERNNTPSEEIVWTGTMKAGDVMHIPRGYWHAATRIGRGGGHSTHVTFGFAKRTAVNWLTWLADWSRREEVFRHDLDRWGSPEVQRAQQRLLATAASRLIDTRDPAEFLTLREQEAPAARHVPFLSIFGPLEAVACVAEFPPLIRECGETVEVLSAGKKLTFAVKALPGLRMLLSGHPVHLDDAARVVGAEIEVLAKILVEEELCANLTPELSSGYTGLVTSAGS